MNQHIAYLNLYEIEWSVHLIFMQMKVSETTGDN